MRAAGTVLNQETAGFIQGYESYRDEDIAKSNPNPEAYRDASSARVAVHWDAKDTFGEGSEFSVAALYRRSRMDFIQHFLIGKPFEHNAQTSYMLSGTASFPFDPLDRARGARRRDRFIRTERVPAGTRDRRNTAGECDPSGRPALRLPGRFLDTGRNRFARIPDLG